MAITGYDPLLAILTSFGEELSTKIRLVCGFSFLGKGLPRTVGSITVASLPVLLGMPRDVDLTVGMVFLDFEDVVSPFFFALSSFSFRRSVEPIISLSGLVPKFRKLYCDPWAGTNPIYFLFHLRGLWPQCNRR